MGHIREYAATVSLPVPMEEAFAYHERPGALKRLVPPWESVEIERSDGSLDVGSRVVLTTRVFGYPVRWVAEHTEYDPPHLFADTQISGPFASWDHRHEFQSEGVGCSLKDQIAYRVPLGALGAMLGGGKALKTIERMFAFRHRLTRDDLQLHADRPTAAMRIAVSGSSGLVGGQLKSLLTLLGHEVRPLVRSISQDSNEIAVWNGEEQAEKLNDVDVVFHLAGKSIADGRWSDSVKQEIRDSRVVKTRELCEAMAKLSHKPKVLVCASATGIYGDQGDQVLDEGSAPGDDFLSGVAQEWEEACLPAVEAGIRVVNARLGIVLSPTGGALQKMLLPAKFAGGALGTGRQWWSWMALDDVIGAFYHVMTDDSISGPVNFVTPNPITNREFASALARVLSRPAIFPAPAFALRAALGEMADALLLASTRVEPGVLTKAGYRYRFTDLTQTLRYLLGCERLDSIQ
jgi:uncharacterized protein (TIGR01777 family)